MNAIYEIWSKIMPQRAIACAFNLEYLLTGGRDARRPEKPIFMFYDWLPGGWGGRNGKDGCNVTTACFGTGLMSQPVEGQERGNPILTTEYRDPDGFGRSRQMARRRRRAQDVGDARGAKRPSSPTSATASERWYGASRAACPPCPTASLETRRAPTRNGSARYSPTCRSATGDVFSRPTAGGGGFGDPLERDPADRAGGRRRRLRLGRARRQGLRRRDQGHRRGAVRIRDRRGRDRSASARRSAPSAAAGSRKIPRRSRPNIAPARSTSSTSCAATPWCSTGTAARCCRSRPRSSANSSEFAHSTTGRRERAAR